MHYASRRTAAFRRIPGSRDRRGATIVVVAVVMVVLFAFTAFAIDFGRAYVSQAQLQTSADAAALAGAIEIRDGTSSIGPSSAALIAAQNVVESVVPELLSLEPGFWNDATRSFTVAADWTTPDIHAVRASTGHTMEYSFARLLGFESVSLAKPAVAVVGSASSAECLKPWGMPIQVAAWAGGRVDYQTNLSNLSRQEIETMITNPAELQIKLGPGNSGNTIEFQGFRLPGNFQALALNGTGASRYEEQIAGTECAHRIAAGDWVTTEPGNMVGPTRDGVSRWCVGRRQNSGICPSPQNQIVVPIFEGNCNGRCDVLVRYVASFEISRWDDGNVWGRFTGFSHPNAGGFTTVPGPIPLTALVQ